MVSPRLAKKPVSEDNPFNMVDESAGSQEIQEESKSSHASDRLALRKSRTINFNFGSIKAAGSQSVDASLHKDSKINSNSHPQKGAGPLIIVEEELAE